MSTYANPQLPNYVPFKQSDYPDTGLGDRDSLEKFFTQQNTALQNMQGAIGTLDWPNLNGTDFQLQITTPATDWVTATLLNSATATDANANGYSTPRFRVAAGGLYLDGACEYSGTGTGTGTVAIPWTFLGGLPIPVGAPSGTSPGANVECGGNLVEVNTTGVFHAISWANGAIIRWYPALGQLQLRSAGSGSPASPWGIPFLSVSGYFFGYPGLQAPPYSCFPVQVRIPDGKIPKDVWLTQVLDQNQGTKQATNVGVCDWAPVQAKAGFPNVFQINNITGLALGRTYTIRGVAKFK